MDDPLIQVAVKRGFGQEAKEFRKLMMDNADSLRETGRELPIDKMKRMARLGRKLIEEGAGGTGVGSPSSPRVINRPNPLGNRPLFLRSGEGA